MSSKEVDNGSAQDAEIGLRGARPVVVRQLRRQSFVRARAASIPNPGVKEGALAGQLETSSDSSSSLILVSISSRIGLTSASGCPAGSGRSQSS